MLSGKFAAVKFLLEKKKFLEMIDFTDDVNITAAGYATQRGNAEIVRYLLENNAKMKKDRKTARLNILDCAYGYFKKSENSLKEIVRFCARNGKIQILQEVFKMFVYTDIFSLFVLSILLPTVLITQYTYIPKTELGVIVLLFFYLAV